VRERAVGLGGAALPAAARPLPSLRLRDPSAASGQSGGRRGVLGALLTLGQGRWALYATGGALAIAALPAGADAARAPATSRILSGGG